MKEKMILIAFCVTIMFCMSACSGNTISSGDNQNAVTEISTSENVETESSEENVMSEGTAMYHTEEIWCENGNKKIYGMAYIPDGDGTCPLVIFSHELGNNHEAGIRYAERLAENGIAAYTFDFGGGSVAGTDNKSSGSNSEMSVMTEADDLELVLNTAKGWEFVDDEKIFLLGGSQGGLVTIVAGSRNQETIAGMMLMYPALSIKEDHEITQYNSIKDVPDDVPLFGGWMHVGKNYVTDIWDTDFYELLENYDGKILLLHGDKDGTVPVSYSERATEIIKDCEFHVIEDGGHEFYGQPFEDAMTYILQYIEGQLVEENESADDEEIGDSTMIMTIGDTKVNVDWEDNQAVEALRDMARDGDVTIQMSMYGGFEQVGSIGQSLPRNDKQTTTSSGDIVLYSGNQMVVFYGSNSWSYTRLGHISDKDEAGMTELLSNGDVTITISMG